MVNLIIVLGAQIELLYQVVFISQLYAELFLQGFIAYSVMPMQPKLNFIIFQ